MRLRGSSRDGARTAALRDFDPAYDRFGSIASDRHPRDAGAMSAFTPIASKLWKRSETPAPDMPSHWVTTGSCHLRTTALPFLICRREWRDVPVNHSRPRRVASFQSRLL